VGAKIVCCCLVNRDSNVYKFLFSLDHYKNSFACWCLLLLIRVCFSAVDGCGLVSSIGGNPTLTLSKSFIVFILFSPVCVCREIEE